MKKKLELALDLAKEHYQTQYESASILDHKAEVLLLGSGLLATLVGIVQSFVGRDPTIGQIIAMIIVFIVFCTMLGFLIAAQRVQSFPTVIDHTWDSISNVVLDKDNEEDAIRQIIANYLDKAKLTSEINNIKSLRINIATILFAADIVGVFLIPLVPF